MAEDGISIFIDDDDDGTGSAQQPRKPRIDVAAAEAEARRARADEARMQAHLIEVEKGRLAARCQLVEVQSAGAATEYERAADEGDFRRQAEIQGRIAELATTKAALEAEQRRVANLRPPPADPVEAMAANLSPRSAQWLRDHHDIASTARGQAKIMAGHHDALAAGHEPDSHGYFNHIERHVGARSGRNSGSRPSSDDNDVRLTKGEADSATDGTHVWGRHDLAAGRIKDARLIGEPIGHREMARRKIEMAKQGLYDR
jgi:hypothetical protein